MFVLSSRVSGLLPTGEKLSLKFLYPYGYAAEIVNIKVVVGWTTTLVALSFHGTVS